MNEWITSGRWLHRLGLIISCICWLSGGLFPSARAETNMLSSPPRIDLARDLVNASLDGDNQKVILLLTNDIGVNARTGPGLTAWQAANIKGHADTMDILAKRGADTNAAFPKPEATLDWYVKQKIVAGSPGLALAVIRDGDLVFKQGWGLANLEYDIPITPSTVFHVASVSKQFTAFAIARLIQQGKLSLDDDVRKYLPEMHDFGTKITVAPFAVPYERTEKPVDAHGSGRRAKWGCCHPGGHHETAGKSNGTDL